MAEDKRPLAAVVTMVVAEPRRRRRTAARLRAAARRAVGYTSREGRSVACAAVPPRPGPAAWLRTTCGGLRAYVC